MASSCPDDIQVDAEPEDDSASRRRSNAGTDHNDRRSSTTADDEYKEYLEFIDKEVPHDIDILIISHEDDIDDVRKFKEDLTKVSYTINMENDWEMVPMVEIFDDIPDYFAPERLDNASSRALFIFLYATKKFCTSKEELVKGYACFMRSLEDERKRFDVIPVHTSPKDCRDYSLSASLKYGLRHINYWAIGDYKNWSSNEFSKQVKTLLESKGSEILNRLKDLEERKKEHFAKDPERFRNLKEFKNTKFSRAESSKEAKSSADQEQHSHAPSDEVTSVASALADMGMASEPDKEYQFSVQSNENPISHASLQRGVSPQGRVSPQGGVSPQAGVQRSFEKEHVFSPSTSYLSRETSLDSLSTERSISLTQAAQSHQVGKHETVQEYFDNQCDDLKAMAVKENRMSRDSNQQTRQMGICLVNPVGLNSSKQGVPQTPSNSYVLMSDVVTDTAFEASIGRDSSNVPRRQQSTEEAEDIYAECVCPASTRQSADGAEYGYITDKDDEDDQTVPKQLY